MPKKVYYLATCDTCKRILKEVALPDFFEKQEIKSSPLTPEQLEELYQLSGSYESLFNKRSRLYKERGLKDKNLEESDYKKLLLEHYTFLKRPVFIVGHQIFIGNSKKNIHALKEALSNL